VVVFLTVCTQKRTRWLATPEVHQLLRSAWCSAPSWLVGRYVVMPDHVHLFAAPAGEQTLEIWVKSWKSAASRAHGNPAWRWQTDHWDRRLRSDESYAEKWEYVVNNPVRHGLVKNALDWPFQGELNALPWR
jgi:putative transposase